MMCSIALQVCDFDNMQPLRYNVDYPGKYAIMFQKATMGWWNGLQEETKTIMLDLYTNYEMSESFYTSVRNNLINMGAFASKQLTHYTKDKFNDMKVKFANLDKIEKNYAESYQDMFVLSIMNGKTNGSYLEIGSGHPSYGNNTYLLEKQFGWNGISIDLSEEFIGLHKNERSHHALLKDATLINYDALLTTMDMPKVIDYLQVDVDPADVSLNVLYSIPFEKYKFRVITFEHDHYADPKSAVREKARKFLTSHGYILVVPNISPDDNRPYEDWFVNPNETDMNMVSRFISNSQETKNAEKFMMGVYNA